MSKCLQMIACEPAPCLQELYKKAANTRAEAASTQGQEAALATPSADDLARLLGSMSDPLTYARLADSREVQEAVAATVQVGAHTPHMCRMCLHSPVAERH
jgi:hypothetical protein